MSGWVVELGFAAQKDLWTFPWSRDVEVGGVVMGRFECSGIARRRDTGRDLSIRRIFASDYGGSAEEVWIDYSAVHDSQTILTRARPGHPGGRWGADDPGLTIGCIHSHPGIDRQRELSDGDIRSASKNADGAPEALQGRPFLSVIATAGEAWREGEPEEDWTNPVLDYFLVFSDKRIVRPQVVVQSEIEWVVEEKQRELLATGGD